MRERRIDAEGARRLREAGFVPEASPTGKQRWQDPETGRMVPGANALAEAKRRGARNLAQAGRGGGGGEEAGGWGPGASALEGAKRREARNLEQAGWEREEVDGETYWRRPDSGRLYPR